MTGLLIAGHSSLADTTDLKKGVLSVQQNTNHIGLGIGYFQQIYRGVNNRIWPIPWINIHYHRLFWRILNGGYTLYKTRTLSADLIVKPNFSGYSSHDSSVLEGMVTKKLSVGAGTQLRYRYKLINVTFDATHDITGRTNGTELGVSTALLLPLLLSCDQHPLLILIPSLTGTWQDNHVVRYYYGVTRSEATVDRAAYDPSSALNISASVNVSYYLSKKWQGNLMYRITRYADSIQMSPIVARRTATLVLAGLSYQFG